MTFADAKPIDPREHVPKVPRSELKVLFQHDYWDGVLSGVLAYKGRKLWFEVWHDSEAGPRQFAIIEMTDEQIQENEYWHELFRRHVGTHCDYDNGMRRGTVRGRDSWPLFYEPFKKRIKPDYASNQVVGWFEI